jgi:hypothetical protein
MSDQHTSNAKDFAPSLVAHRREISGEQMRKFEGFAGEILSAFGMDLSGPATAETPRRFIEALRDATTDTTSRNG